jgi:hypothetical protein
MPSSPQVPYLMSFSYCFGLARGIHESLRPFVTAHNWRPSLPTSCCWQCNMLCLQCLINKVTMPTNKQHISRCEKIKFTTTRLLYIGLKIMLNIFPYKLWH